MAYKLKTLVIFDTNALRTIESGEVAYSFFAFGRPFRIIEEFIMEKKLSEDIHIAIPAWVIEELKDQKLRQYKTDIDEFKKLVKRLSGMPHIREIALPEEEFDFTRYIQEKAQEFLVDKKINLLEIKTELANEVLQSMMKRVMKDENKKKPFAHSGKYKDAGFKDNIVWESLMHFDGVTEYDKVIFITKDSDYANCEVEFMDKWNKHISIEKDENNAVVEIQKDYELYITEREIYGFTQTDFFKSYLSDNLKDKSEITVGDQNHTIEDFEIIDKCKQIERIPPNQDFDEKIIIHSSIEISYTEAGAKKQHLVFLKTVLADDVTRDITETTFEPELI